MKFRETSVTIYAINHWSVMKLDTEFEATMKEIVQAITEAGYEPYDQLYGYVTKGKEEYITRNGNAREKIKKLNWLKVKQHVENWK